MNDKLQVFSNDSFTVRTLTDAEGTVWFVAKDIAQALEYSEATISNMDKTIGMVPDCWKGRYPIPTVERGLQEMLCLTEQGVYFFLGRSDKPKALPYQMWIAGDVVPSIHATGSYSVAVSHEDRELKHEELSLRKQELDLRRAVLLKDVLDAPPFPLTDETRTVFGHEVFRLTTGKEYLAMLPECTEKWYTASEIGEMFGISANKAGRIANANGLKAPAGESNEYGRWIFSKSKYSSKECPKFIYSEAAVDWFRQYQNGTLLERR